MPREAPTQRPNQVQPTQYLKKQNSIHTEEISMADFLCRAVLGRGHFGKVILFRFFFIFGFPKFVFDESKILIKNGNLVMT